LYLSSVYFFFELIFLFAILIDYVSVKSKLKHPPQGIPRAFDVFSCPGGREFDELSLSRGGEFDHFS